MARTDASPVRFASFREFYPFYLDEHRDRTCRRLHFVGSTLALVFVGVALLQANAWWLLAALVSGYGCAWVATSSSRRTGRRPSSTRCTALSATG